MSDCFSATLVLAAGDASSPAPSDALIEAALRAIDTELVGVPHTVCPTGGLGTLCRCAVTLQGHSPPGDDPLVFRAHMVEVMERLQRQFGKEASAIHFWVVDTFYV